MGLELELLSGHLPTIRTTTTTQLDGDDHDAVDDDGCATPTAPAHVLRAPSVCPPAPMKPRPPPAKRRLQRRRRCGSSAAPPPVRWFIAVPHDVLAAVFVARPCMPPASKKIRVHFVG
uniref:Uncharacterized protein n=1 Tax=Arundo donax TaxID=35708 RepID=A0A0A8ZN16_ARUDO